MEESETRFSRVIILKAGGVHADDAEQGVTVCLFKNSCCLKVLHCDTNVQIMNFKNPSVLLPGLS